MLTRSWTLSALFLCLGCATGGDTTVEVKHGCAGDEDCARGQFCVAGACQATVEPDEGADVRSMDATVDAAKDVEAPLPVDARPDRAVDAIVDLGPEPDLGADVAPDAEADQGPDAELGCVPGTIEDCGQNQGVCRAGIRECEAEGVWGPCEGAIEPSDEICNGADDDCNGTIDDGFDIGGACDGIGACGDGVLECRNEIATRCSTDPGGRTDESRGEQCNEADDDCDGSVDEGLGVGDDCVGQCGPGSRECGGAGNLQCSTDPGGSESAIGDEICNQRDDDCDGTVDEGFGLGEACVGEGACGAGVQECSREGPVCSTEPGGSANAAIDEACNGADDDCDGTVDESLGLRLECMGVGICDAGLTECNRAGQVVCSTDPGASESPAGEERCNELDDDCDGMEDEGLGLGDDCPAVGVCPAGVLVCGAEGATVCSGIDQAVEEGCNELDDDCDGSPDEGFGVGEACVGTGECGAGVLECSAEGGAQCSTEGGGSADQTGEEVCDGLDNDCDGELDEGEGCGGEDCATASELPLNAPRTGNTTGLQDDYDRGTCLGAAPGPDQVFRIVVPAAGEYVVGAGPLEANYDPLFWVGGGGDCEERTVEGCAAAGAGRDAEGAGRPEARSVNLPRAATFTVVVDSRIEQHGGPFVVSARPVEDGERCGNAIAATPPFRFVGLTSGRDRDVVGDTCPAGVQTTGPDQVFRLDLAAAQEITATVVPGQDVDVVLYIVGACGQVDDTCQAGSNAGGLGVTEQVRTRLEAGTWYVVVDHPITSEGVFQLSIE